MTELFRILVVEDEKFTADHLSALLIERLVKVTVETGYCISDGRNIIANATNNRQDFDVAVLDYCLPEERDGLPLESHDLPQTVREAFPRALICHVTAFEASFPKYLKASDDAFIAKRGRWGSEVAEVILKNRAEVLRRETFVSDEMEEPCAYRGSTATLEQATSSLAQLVRLIEIYYEGVQRKFWSENFMSDMKELVDGFGKRRNQDGSFYVWLDGGNESSEESLG